MTRWVLAHKRIVVAFRTLVTVVGIATVGSVTSAARCPARRFWSAGGSRASERESEEWKRPRMTGGAVIG